MNKNIVKLTAHKLYFKKYPVPYKIPKIKVPKKITPCPIAEAVIEIRFEPKPDIPEQAIFGLVYNAVKGRFGKIINLPILELPLQIRTSDENLKYRPHYRLESDKYSLQIGSRVVSLVAREPYQGWDDFFKELKNNIQCILKLEIIESVKRLGLRYINYFENKIFDNVDVSIITGKESLVTSDTLFRTTIKEENINFLLQIINDAVISIEEKTKKGSALDIDASLEQLDNYSFTEYEKLIENAHELEKRLFFSLLKEDFLGTLNPEY